MSDHKYKLAYKLDVRPEGYSKEEAQRMMKEQDLGSCDAALFCSMIYPKDGSFSVYFLGVDGRVKDKPHTLEDNEWFKVWCLLANRLAYSETLDAYRKDFALKVFNQVREAILKAADNEDMDEFERAIRKAGKQ